MVLLLVSIFIIGYLAIASEGFIGINKAATALVTGVLCWCVIIFAADDKMDVLHRLSDHIGEISGILFFLLGAMTIVELIDAHNGFDVITRNITVTNTRKLLWIISFLTFVLSPVLDNLTTAIVMISLVRKLINDQKQRLYFAGMIIIASNAGGAWSPIGDVTTTMLWIGGQVTALNILIKLFLPSLVCLLVPLLLISFRFNGQTTRPLPELTGASISRQRQHVILGLGVLILLFVPVFKMTTGLPPFMGILIGLGILWIVTEILDRRKEEDSAHLSVSQALRRIDAPSILFFLGILLAVAGLQSAGILTQLAGWMDNRFGNHNAIVLSLGLLSAVVDNVPLVAAAQGMYSLSHYPTDHYFWEFLAYSVGTGGSVFIIGSAAGVAVMGMEDISFLWYLKNISLLAILGFFAGAAVYVLQHWL